MARLLAGVKSYFGSSVDGDMELPEEISCLQDSLIQNPLPLDILLETINSSGGNNADKENQQVSKEQLMHLSGKMSPNTFTDVEAKGRSVQNGKTHIIVVVDGSGSMSGNPFNQVKMSLESIVGQCIDSEGKVIDIIVYDSQAKIIKFTIANYKKVIHDLKAGGTTNFKAAFDETLRVMDKQKSQNIQETIILFMTDGKDTVSHQSKANEYAKKWAQTLKQQSHQVIVHTIGFSKDHDLTFLKKISKAGNTEGLYRYSEQGDGPEALRDKLEELFDYVSLSEGRPIQFEITMGNLNNKFVLSDSNNGSVEGIINVMENEKGEAETLASGECWVCMDDPLSLPEISVGIQMVIKKNHVKYTMQIPCTVGSIRRIIRTDPSELALWNLAVLSRNTDALSTKVAEAVTAAQDVSTLKDHLDSLQTKLSQTEVFKAGFNKDTRAQILELVKEAQGKIDKLHGMLAQYLRGEAKSISLLARAHDLRYEAKFSKSRRERMMNRRVAQNFAVVKSDSQRAVLAREEDLSQLSQEATEFYHCILSMCSVKDILLDATDLENAIGIGLAVSRPEHAIDEPTSIRIFNISGSLVSRSSVMDALEFKINLSGQLSAHSGFSFGSFNDGSFGYATVGASRDPINAWIPLYVIPAHWERVRSCLRPSLGYLCTLDPLGYSDSQLDILFMVLGSMIGQLSKDNVGENQLKLIFAMQKTCSACLEDFHLNDKLTKLVEEFLLSPMGRFRNVVPNLFTMIGYIASLPVNVTRRLLISTCGGENTSLSRLWVAMISEEIRRANSVNTEFHENENQVISLLNLLLHGRGSETNCQPETSSSVAQAFVNLEQLCWSLSTLDPSDYKLDIPEYDPGQHVTVPEVIVKNTPKVDRAMEIWAQSHCGLIKNKNRADQVADAKTTVKKWIGKLREKIGLPQTKALDVNTSTQLLPGKATEVPPCSTGTQPAHPVSTSVSRDEEKAASVAAAFDSTTTTTINSSVLEVTAKVLSRLSQQCYPHLSCLPGAIGFMEFWIKMDESLGSMASNGGLPPPHWIQGVKDSVRQVFDKMEGFRHACENATQTQETRNGGPGMDDDETPNRGEGTLVQKDAEVVTEDNEEDYVFEDEEEELAEQFRRKHKTNQTSGVTLPMLLSALNLEGDSLQLVRAMLCQAVSYPSNSQAREATSSGQLLDLAAPGNAPIYLNNVDVQLLERKEAALKKLQDQRMSEISNMCMLRADSIWAFIGYLMIAYKERGEGFGQLINFIIECSGAKGFPLLEEKVLVLLSGKYEEHVVLAKGNSWLPDKKMAKCLQAVVGEEAWMNIERILLSNVHIHVYRESDLPNRHGHCNSNPYIPNRVRELLNMPLIDEKLQPRTRPHRHRSHKK